MPRSFVDQLVKNRFRSNKEIRRILDAREKERQNRSWAPYLTGTHNGVFFRIKVPPRRRRFPDLPKLPSSQTPPIKFKETPTTTPPSPAPQPWFFRETISGFQDWLVKNWSVLVFNFGSICTLVGFTRSDILELRALSVTGSFCAVVYNLVQHERRWPPILWSCLFGTVNGWKIFQIVQESKGTVHLTADEEDIYVKHFLPHGVTPKQFEAVLSKAETLQVPKGKILIKQGDRLLHVFLVVQGSTRASVLGRHLSAASATPKADMKRGGASGAWIGEMAFLESCWVKDQGRKFPKTEKTKEAKVKQEKDVSKGDQKEAAVEPSKEEAAPVQQQPSKRPDSSPDSSTPKPFKPPLDVPIPIKSDRALYTIVAEEDCTILRWSHADMEGLMNRSTDMRAAVTRAMASAIVGKVINFTVSRSTGATWSSWLGDWKNADGARVEVENELEATEDTSGVDSLDEKLPSHPIKKFR